MRYIIALEEVCLLERLFSSSLVTVVSQSSPRKLRVCHFQKNTEICNHSYSNTVLAVRLNRLVIFVIFSSGPKSRKTKENYDSGKILYRIEIFSNF